MGTMLGIWRLVFRVLAYSSLAYASAVISEEILRVPNKRYCSCPSCRRFHGYNQAPQSQDSVLRYTLCPEPFQSVCSLCYSTCEASIYCRSQCGYPVVVADLCRLKSCECCQQFDIHLTSPSLGSVLQDLLTHALYTSGTSFRYKNETSLLRK